MKPLQIAAALPDPVRLRSVSLAIAALDTMLCPEWHLRTYSFDPHWGMQEHAAMNNGCGDEYHILFSALGTVLRAFDHESYLSPWGRGSVDPAILLGFPDQLRDAIDEVAFRTEGCPDTELTFCAWRTTADTAWRVGSIEDDGGATELLDVVLADSPVAYCDYASEYFEIELQLELVEHVFGLQPVDVAFVTNLNPNADGRAVMDELAEMRYPGRERR